MADISIAHVKALREKTGAGMMSCKEALKASGGEFEAAVDWLRTQGLAMAAKKQGRAATQGLVAVATTQQNQESHGALVEINAETDFAARSPQFQDFARRVVDALLKSGDPEKLAAAAYATGKTITTATQELTAAIGEKVALRRGVTLSVSQGVVAGYSHNKVAEGLGTIGALVALESSADPAALAPHAYQLAMHVAAAQPRALKSDTLDPQEVARERKLLEERAASEGKPQELVARMVEGRLRKFYQEACLLEQTFVVDGQTPIKDLLKAWSQDLGVPVSIKDFATLRLGEGVDKKSQDFAAEVIALSKTS